MAGEDDSKPRSRLITRRMMLQSSAVLAGTALSDPVVADSDRPRVTVGPDQTETTLETTTELSDPPTVLLIRDCDMWSTTGNETALNELGYEYTVLSSAVAANQLPDYSQLDEIDIIILPSTQDRSFYRNVNTIWETITEFVRTGGVLVAHAGELGWPCSVGSRPDDSLIKLPRGVTNDYTFLRNRQGEEVTALQELTVRNADHPVAEGLSGADLSYWASDISTFGYFSEVPDDATEVFGLEVDPEAHPTYVEYPAGQGRVLTTMQPLEGGYNQTFDGVKQLLRQELSYAVETAKEIAPPPERGRTRGTVTVADTGESVDTGTIHLIDPIYKGDVDAFIENDEPLPETIASTTLNDGSFVFDEIEPGKSLLLVTPNGQYSPIYKTVTVPIEETTRVSFELSSRPLAELEPNIAELADNTRSVVENSTDDVAWVYYNAAELFDTELDKGDVLGFALSTMDFALSFGDPDGLPLKHELAGYIGENTTIPLAEHGYNEQIAAQVNQIQSDVFRQDLKNYANKCLTTDWITSLQNSGSVPIARSAFSNTPMYQTALNEITTASETFEKEIATQNADESFSVKEVRRVLETQARWVANNGIASGVVFTPQGTGYTTRSTKYHRGHYEGLESELESTELLETASSAVSVAGKATAKYTAATVHGVPLAVLGSVAAVGGTIGSYVFSTHQVYLQNQLANAWTDSLLYWVSDLEDAPAVMNDVLSWLESEIANPTLQQTEGEIIATDLGGISLPQSETTYALANGPSYPVWWEVSPLPAPKWQRRATNTIEIENTGDIDTEFNISTVDTYGDGQTTGVSDAVSLYPPKQESADLESNSSTEVELEYSADFQWNSPFNWHHMTTTLWMNGKAVDTVDDTYYIIPTLGALPGPLANESNNDTLSVKNIFESNRASEISLKTEEYQLTDQSKRDRETLTLEDWDQNIGEIQPISNTKISPLNPSIETIFTTPSSAEDVTFVLTAPPSSDVNLHIRDNKDRHVGYDPEKDEDLIEIPNTEYNGHKKTIQIASIKEAAGKYGIEAEGISFFDNEPIPVKIYAITVPEREPILGVSPTVAKETIRPGESVATRIDVSEISNQNDIQLSDVSLAPFKTKDGEQLTDVDIRIVNDQSTVLAGETETLRVEFDAAQSINLPNKNSARFSSELTIETAAAGTSIIEVSVLVYTSKDGIRLEGASKNIEGITVKKISNTRIPTPPRENIEIKRGYKIEATGDGVVSLSVPTEIPEDKEVRVYKINDENWEKQETSVGERAVVDVDVPSTKIFAITYEKTIGVIQYYSNNDKKIGNEGVFNAVRDWQNKAGWFKNKRENKASEAIFKLVQAWQSS